MAEAQEAPKKDEKPAAAAPAAKSKKPLLIGVGAVVVAALGGMVSMLAVPKPHEAHPTLKGPFITKLAKTALKAKVVKEVAKALA